MIRIAVLLLVLLLVIVGGGIVFLSSYDPAAPSVKIEKVVPDARFAR
ncbi:hypothetical protein [Paramagnetospirillum marisnigri]|nr:hypothetical protein [Paramagnetospirillum marisnigri]